MERKIRIITGELKVEAELNDSKDGPVDLGRPSD